MTPYQRGIRYLQARTNTFTAVPDIACRCEALQRRGQPTDAVGALPLTLCASYLSRARTSERATLRWAQPAQESSACAKRARATHRTRWTRTRCNTAQRHARRRRRAAPPKKRCPRNDFHVATTGPRRPSQTTRPSSPTSASVSSSASCRASRSSAIKEGASSPRSSWSECGTGATAERRPK